MSAVIQHRSNHNTRARKRPFSAASAVYVYYQPTNRSYSPADLTDFYYCQCWRGCMIYLPVLTNVSCGSRAHSPAVMSYLFTSACIVNDQSALAGKAETLHKTLFTERRDSGYGAACTFIIGTPTNWALVWRGATTRTIRNKIGLLIHNRILQTCTWSPGGFNKDLWLCFYKAPTDSSKFEQFLQAPQIFGRTLIALFSSWGCCGCLNIMKIPPRH